MRFLLGVIVGILLVFCGVFAYIRFGSLPVATSDAPFPMERQLTHAALDSRIASAMIKTPPIPADQATFAAAVPIYRQQCASCHGVPGKDSDFAKGMYPRAPQLFEKHHNGVVGVSDDEPGETQWKVANGIRLTGMPAYKSVLSDTQIWQVSLLLANADKLPAETLQSLAMPQATQP
jgi:mono/diheme cytochrome c family protein